LTHVNSPQPPPNHPAPATLITRARAPSPSDSISHSSLPHSHILPPLLFLVDGPPRRSLPQHLPSSLQHSSCEYYYRRLNACVSGVGCRVSGGRPPHPTCCSPLPPRPRASLGKRRWRSPFRTSGRLGKASGRSGELRRAASGGVAHASPAGPRDSCHGAHLPRRTTPGTRVQAGANRTHSPLAWCLPLAAPTRTRKRYISLPPSLLLALTPQARQEALPVPRHLQHPIHVPHGRVCGRRGKAHHDGQPDAVPIGCAQDCRRLPTLQQGLLQRAPYPRVT
jgi:hypothetical protein